MTKLVIAIVIVAALLVGGLIQLLRNSRQPMGTPEQLERAKQRNREIEEQGRRERELEE
jgi:hypothetical protein